jgi:hypothetical protein
MSKSFYILLLFLTLTLFVFYKAEAYATTSISLKPDSGEISSSASGTAIDLDLDFGGFDDVIGVQFYVYFNGSIKYLDYEEGNFDCEFQLSPSENDDSPLDFACVAPTTATGITGTNPFLTLFFKSTGAGTATIEVTEVEYIVEGKEDLSSGLGDTGTYTTAALTTGGTEVGKDGEEDEELPETSLFDSSITIVGFSILFLSILFFASMDWDTKRKVSCSMKDKVS